MSVLPQLERDLLEAAERRLATGSDGAGARAGDRPRARLGARGARRRLRLLALALVCVLATATIALAATGVILTGAPVRPEGPLNPSAGEGVPAPGASQLLPLRVPDPEGGPPWGMRIVRTTRGEVCEQIGRIQGGQLGELGIDGVFHDDGRFHPIPADVLPETSRVGAPSSQDDATETVSCQLAGQVSVGEYVGVDRSAGAADGHERAQPRSALRDISFGLLGARRRQRPLPRGLERPRRTRAGAARRLPDRAAHSRAPAGGRRLRKPRHGRRPAALRTADRDHLPARRETLRTRTRPGARRHRAPQRPCARGRTIRVAATRRRRTCTSRCTCGCGSATA